VRYHDGRGRRPAHWQRRPLKLAVVLALIQVLGSMAAQRGQPEARPLDLLGYALLVIGPLAMELRLRWRVPALVGTMVATAAYFTLRYPHGPAFLAALFAVFGAVRAGHRVAVWVLTGLAYLTYVFAGRLVGGDLAQHFAQPGPARAVLVATWLAILLAVAETVRMQTAHFAEVGRTRTEQRRRQASEERLRIARELHDVLGHHLSLINVQASVGLHLMDERPEQARASLAAIKQASAEALREVRSVLAALRPDEESAPRAPTPGLADLPRLVADVTGAGLTVDVVTEGATRPLPAEVDRAALRLIQEALTNVRRHAGPGAAAVVTVTYGDDDLVVRIRDHGQGGPAGDGAGLTGMSERVAALRGDFAAGPHDDGGFEVYARLPAMAASGRSEAESAVKRPEPGSMAASGRSEAESAVKRPEPGSMAASGRSEAESAVKRPEPGSTVPS
jgi:signal transduction histidine kinase